MHENSEKNDGRSIKSSKLIWNIWLGNTFKNYLLLSFFSHFFFANEKKIPDSRVRLLLNHLAYVSAYIQLSLVIITPFHTHSVCTLFLCSLFHIIYRHESISICKLWISNKSMNEIKIFIFTCNVFTSQYINLNNPDDFLLPRSIERGWNLCDEKKITLKNN